VSIISERPHLHSLVSSIYNTEYDKFFIELAAVEQVYLIPSRLLSIHTRFYVREMRIKAYNQLLESYKSVSMESMAKAFGVTEEFIDRFVFIHSWFKVFSDPDHVFFFGLGWIVDFLDLFRLVN
jgi:hypothetical protein